MHVMVGMQNWLSGFQINKWSLPCWTMEIHVSSFFLWCSLPPRFPKDYKLEKMAMTNFDASLISTTLQTELYVGQRTPGKTRCRSWIIDCPGPYSFETLGNRKLFIGCIISICEWHEVAWSGKFAFYPDCTSFDFGDAHGLQLVSWWKHCSAN